MPAFDIDERLARDGFLITTLDLCQVRINNDRRWPWLVLIPQRDGMTEIFELSPADQALLASETQRVAAALKLATGATKINIGALGNIVRQLHVHVISRHEGDANWPGPVWGFGAAEPWDDSARQAFADSIMEHLAS